MLRYLSYFSEIEHWSDPACSQLLKLSTLILPHNLDAIKSRSHSWPKIPGNECLKSLSSRSIPYIKHLVDSAAGLFLCLCEWEIVHWKVPTQHSKPTAREDFVWSEHCWIKAMDTAHVPGSACLGDPPLACQYWCLLRHTAELSRECLSCRIQISVRLSDGV